MKILLMTNLFVDITADGLVSCSILLDSFPYCKSSASDNMFE